MLVTNDTGVGQASQVDVMANSMANDDPIDTIRNLWQSM